MPGRIRPAADLHNPLRHACDRCHLQKLRCPRSDTSDKHSANEACSRCRKAGVPCVVSVRGKVGRPCKVVKKKPHGALSTLPTLPPPPPPAPTTVDVRFDTPGGDDADAGLGPGLGPGPGPGVGTGTGTYEMEQQQQQQQQPWESSPGDSLATLVMEPVSLDDGKGDFKGIVGIDTPGGGLVSGASYDHHSSGFGHSAVSPPLSGTTSYDAFCLNVDDHVDFTSMFLSPSTIMTGTTMGSSRLVTSHHLDAAAAAADNHGDTWMPTAERTNTTTNDARYLDEAFRDAEGSEESILPIHNTTPPTFCSTACYGRLLDLNVRILTCLTNSGSPEAVNHRIQRDVVGFSGELIEAARESLPHLVGVSFRSSSFSFSSSSSPSSSSSSSSSDSSPASAQMTDGRASSCDDVEGSADSDAGFGYSSMDDKGGGGGHHLAAAPPSRSWPVPESAVIFLLVGCYTQILHLLELTIHHLSDQFHGASRHENDDGGGGGGGRDGNTPSVSSAMEASLTVHTVTYLLGRLHQGFVPPPGPGGYAQTPTSSGSVSAHQSWGRVFTGRQDGSEDGLLGRAFDEVKKRERMLVRRMDHFRRTMGEI